MKKILFFVVALASVAVGCTKSEVVKAPNRGVEIKFDTYIGKTPVTKAEEVNLDYLKDSEKGGFRVIGYIHEKDQTVPTSKTYMDKIVTWDEEKWSYDGVVYWPDQSSTRKLAFSAYGINVQADAENPLITWDSEVPTTFTYSVPDKVSEQQDLVVAPFQTNLGISGNGENATVSFTFHHLLSRIGFQVKANNDSDVTIDIKEISLVNQSYFPVKGTVDLTSTTASISPIIGSDAETRQTYELFPGEEYFTTTSKIEPSSIYANAGVETANAANRYMMVMPCDIGQGSYIQVNYLLEGAETQIANIPIYVAPDPQSNVEGFTKFEAGKSYIFQFKVSTTAVAVDVIVNPWQEKWEGGKVIEL